MTLEQEIESLKRRVETLEQSTLSTFQILTKISTWQEKITASISEITQILRRMVG